MSILDDCNARFEQHKAEKHQRFAARAVKRVCDYFAIEVGSLVDDPEFGCGWFAENYPTFPVKLEARNVKVDVGRLFQAMTKTPIWTELISFLESIGNVRGGVIFPIEGHGLFIAHSWWTISEVPGFTRLMRKATNKDEGIVIESLESFLVSVSQSGWSA